LGRTSEFLIYGHGQQRRTAVEAVRLFESEKGNQSPIVCKINGSSNDVNVYNFKDKSHKWQKFMTKVCLMQLFPPFPFN